MNSELSSALMEQNKSYGVGSGGVVGGGVNGGGVTGGGTSVSTEPVSQTPPVNDDPPADVKPSAPKPDNKPKTKPSADTTEPDGQGSPSDDNEPHIPDFTEDYGSGNGSGEWCGNGEDTTTGKGDFFDDNKELIKKAKNILDFVYPDSGITLAELLTGAKKYIDIKSSHHGEGYEDKLPDIDSIKDLTVDEIKEMNSDDEYFEIEINEYGYIETILGKFSDVTIKSSDEALHSLLSIKTAIGISDPFEELRLYSINEDETGTIFNFKQFLNGVPCFDNNIIIACDRNGTAKYLRSSYFPVNTTISTSPQISYNGINNAIIKEYPESSIIDVEEDKRLLILNYYGKVYLVWNKYIELSSNIYNILVDSNNGKILYKNVSNISFSDEDLTVTQNDLLGKSRTINVVKKSDGNYYLEDRKRNIIVYNGQGKQSIDNELLKKQSIPVAYPDNNQWSDEEISVMANMEEIYDFYKNTFKRKSFDNGRTKENGADINVYINTTFINQARWAPSIQSFVIGKGDGLGAEKISYAVSKGILCHEFTHAVVSKTTKLEKVYFGTAGAINEAYADIMACLFTGSWTIGNDVALRVRKNFRNIAFPHNSGDGYYPEFFGDIKKGPQINGFIDYKSDKTDLGGVHRNSTIISHCAYLMTDIIYITQRGIEEDRLKQLWYKSLCLYYPAHSDFYTVRQNVKTAAILLDFSEDEMEIIKQAFDEVKIDEKCKEEKDYFDYADSQVYLLDHKS